MAEWLGTFRKPLLENRCLIPATNYFEWQKTGNKKQKTALMLPEKQPLFMAGFFRREKDIPYPVFVIMTREAGHTISQIHQCPSALSCQIFSRQISSYT